MVDLVTFGETMLRLSPPRGVRLSRADDLSVHVGGAESNVAVAGASLGLETAWLSKLPSTDLGERVVHALRGEDVEPLVAWADEGRVGTYYFEPGAVPRNATVHYDRAGAAVRSARPDDLDLERVRDADAFLTTGITPALSETLTSTTADLLSLAADAGVTTVFDVNYREKLWDVATARETLLELFEAVDVLFVAERDARGVLGREGDPRDVASDLRATHGFETVVLTRGEAGAVAAVDDAVHEQPAFQAETVDPVGSGDAFVGGFLARRLDDGSVPEALEFGAAAAALKRTVEGDVAQLSPEEVEAVVARDTGGTGDSDGSNDAGVSGGSDGISGSDGSDGSGGSGGSGHIDR